MLKHLIGLLRPDAGEVWFRDFRVDRTRESDLGKIRQRFGFLFQHSALFDSMTVEQNVAFPLQEHHDLNRRQRRQRVEEVLDMVGLANTIHRMPGELSGGQQKRIALARALVLEPEIMLYDEPTTGLDPIRANTINALIRKLKVELGVTSIVVTHDLNSAFQIADTMVMLHGGRVILEADPQTFRRSQLAQVRRFLDGGHDPEQHQSPSRVDASGMSVINSDDDNEPEDDQYA